MCTQCHTQVYSSVRTVYEIKHTHRHPILPHSGGIRKHICPSYSGLGRSLHKLVVPNPDEEGGLSHTNLAQDNDLVAEVPHLLPQIHWSSIWGNASRYSPAVRKTRDRPLTAYVYTVQVSIYICTKDVAENYRCATAYQNTVRKLITHQ